MLLSASEVTIVCGGTFLAQV